MSKEKVTRAEPLLCPFCGRYYTEAPALSRVDNATLICPDCGTREALASLGCSEEEQLRILDTIHNHTRRSNNG